MKRIYLAVRIVLFALILSLGTMAALVVNETQGLALADLSGAPVRGVTTVAEGDAVYAVLSHANGLESPGIYRSVDNGNTWQRLGSAPDGAITALAVPPTQAGGDLLYAGTAGGLLPETGTLWYSEDSGQTWRPFPLGLPSGPDRVAPAVTALVVDRHRPDVLYVGTDGQGVYRYQARASQYGYELIGGLALHDAHIRGLVVGPDGRLYALTNQGLFVSDGQRWEMMPVPEMPASLAVAPDDPQTLYLGGVSTGLYRSTDGGRTWERVETGLELTPGAALRVTALAVDEADPRQVAAATAYGLGNKFAPDGVYLSRDGGYRWSKVAAADEVVTQLNLHRGVIYAATARGLAGYGEPSAPQATSPLARLGSGDSPLQRLADPSGVQVLILILTAILAGLALVGRTEWRLRKRAHRAQS